MVQQLPRNLDDDYTFNVHILRHMVYKTPYLKGFIKKTIVKQWLLYEGHLESRERLRIQPAQLFHCS
jgi:hypothetical protein